MKKYIISNEKILGGMPVIAGTRLPIARVLFLLKEGYSISGIQKEFPHIAIKTIEGAVDEVISGLEYSHYGSKASQI